MRPHNFLLAGLMMLLPIWMLSVWGSIADASGLQITSGAFSDGANIPTKFTCSGADTSPPLSWTDVPVGTESLALILEDPDAPKGTFVHWVVYDIPASLNGFDASEVQGTQGVNSLGKTAYMGPCPPPGAPHHYHFRLFALDTKLNLEGAVTAAVLRDAMKGHIKDSADEVGVFGR